MCATDYFYDIPHESPKWISSIEGDGFGLIHYSDFQFVGRKAFFWGKSTGGQHWNEWLTTDRDYLEIQAGLCKTQFEHFEIPAHHHLEWNELYSGVQLNSVEYFNGVAEINTKLPNISNQNAMFKAETVEKPTVLGSGRGYLAEKLHGIKFGEKYDFCKESVGKNEEYYLALLEKRFVSGNENTEFVYDQAWKNLILCKNKLSAFDYYILGIIEYEHGRMDKAKACFEKSLENEIQWYTLAATAQLFSSVFGKHAVGYQYIEKAVALRPNEKELFVTFGEIAIRAEKYNEFFEVFKNSSPHIQSMGRLRMYAGQCLVMLYKTEEAKEYINERLVVPDIREGEYAISNVWIMLYRKEMAKKNSKDEDLISDEDVLREHPIPSEIDFRMH